MSSDLPERRPRDHLDVPGALERQSRFMCVLRSTQVIIRSFSLSKL